MRFLVDAQLPPVLVEWLRARGRRADHINDLLGPTSSDHSIAERAKLDDAVIVSKDGDFISLLDDRADPALDSDRKHHESGAVRGP